MSDTQGPKLYQNIFCKCLNWCKMRNYSFYLRGVKLLMKLGKYFSATFKDVQILVYLCFVLRFAQFHDKSQNNDSHQDLMKVLQYNFR